MPIEIIKGTTQYSHCGIRYITIFDTLFHPNQFAGALFFYQKDSHHVVTVEITNSRDKLKEEDIVIYIGEAHNSEDTEFLIKEKTDLIYEMCKSTSEPMFILNLDDLSLPSKQDFTSFLPKSGLGSLFIFENIALNADFVHCIRNRGGSNITDRDCFAWLLSYIYSGAICFTPKNLKLQYGKQFMQAISQLIFYNGKEKSIHITQSFPVLNVTLADVGQEDYDELKLKKKRLGELVQKAVFQSMPQPKGQIL